ncbi:MAG: 50S ribosomal protein L4 [Bacteroidetes bacterium]|nr:50S ribosomal protein L4 [Bacteroidota bacterium]
MELKVLNKLGQETGRTIELSDSIWGIEPNDHAIYLDVKRYMADLRQGTHKAKERGEIKGSTKKLRKQKGAGHARVGNIKNPLFKGGGRVFGPRPRVYTIKVNKKVRALARKSAFAYKAKTEAIVVVEDFDFQNPKTQEYKSIMNNLNANTKALHLIADDNLNVWLSSRNLKNVKVLTPDLVNTYEIVNHKVLVISENAVKQIEEQYN